MLFTIYQISNIDKSNYIFRGFDRAKDQFNLSDYEVVARLRLSTDESIESALEELFYMLNRENNFNLNHSLSVSDVVRVDTESSSGDQLAGYYYCDNFGWAKIDEEYL